MMMLVFALMSLLLGRLALASANVCEPAFFPMANRTIPRGNYSYPFIAAFGTNASTEISAIRYSPDFSKLVFVTSNSVFVHGPVPPSSSANADWERPLRCVWNSPEAGLFSHCDILSCYFVLSDDSKFLTAAVTGSSTRGFFDVVLLDLESCEMRWTSRFSTALPAVDVDFFRGDGLRNYAADAELLFAIGWYSSEQNTFMLTIRSAANGALVAESPVDLGRAEGGKSINVSPLGLSGKRTRHETRLTLSEEINTRTNVHTHAPRHTRECIRLGMRSDFSPAPPAVLFRIFTR